MKKYTKLIKIFMKKIIILFTFLLLQVWVANAATFNAWQVFRHSYTINNNFSCQIRITRITKCYDVSMTNPGWAQAFSNVQLRWWIFRTTNSGCYTYNPNYIISPNTSDYDWDIGFWTNIPPTLIWTQVNSTFSFDFQIIWGCIDNWSITTAQVASSIVWQYCWDGVVNLWETCDYNDSSQFWWGTATPWCNTSCQPVLLLVHLVDDQHFVEIEVFKDLIVI